MLRGLPFKIPLPCTRTYFCGLNSLFFSERRKIISHYSIKRMIFLTEALCAYCAVRTESLNNTWNESQELKANFRHPISGLTTRDSSSFVGKIPCKFCGRQYVTGTGLYRSTWRFPRQYHSTNAPYSLYLNAVLIRRTSERRMGNVKESKDNLSQSDGRNN